MDSNSTQKNFNSELEPLIESIGRPGEYCAQGRLTCPMPRLEIDGIGMLSFPVPEFQARQLIGFAEQAPYGKGEQTLVDTSVRNCWEIAPENFSLGGKGWNATLQEMLGLAAEGLGCNSAHLSAEIYKLLIYEAGGFFLPHRDTEKSDGMIATMTISLPVAGTGGELIVRHNGEEKTIQLNVDEPSELAFAAFYADCEHEIKEVRSGYRLSLVYNLCVPKEETNFRWDAAAYYKQVGAIAAVLDKWIKDDGTSNKHIWLLEHKYSQIGLSFSTLKNGDLTVAGALKAASGQIPGCDLYAASLRFWELYDQWDKYGRPRENDTKNLRKSEIVHSGRYLENLLSPEGFKPALESVGFSENEVIQKGVLEKVDPDEENFQEFTGNDGGTITQQYRLAVLALFKSKQTHDVFSNSSRSKEKVLTWIRGELKHNGGHSSGEIIARTESLVNAWDPNYYYDNEEIHRQALEVLTVIGDCQLSKKFLLSLADSEYFGCENSEIIDLLGTLKLSDAQKMIMLFARKRFSEKPQPILNLLLKFISEIHSKNNGESKFIRDCALEILEMLPQCMESLREYHAEYDPECYYDYCRFNHKAVGDLFVLFWHADVLDTGFTSAMDIFANYPGLYRVDKHLPTAIKSMKEIDGLYRSDVYSSVWRIAADFHLERSDVFPKKPSNWIIDAPTCDCHLCQKLKLFCTSPNTRTEQFAVTQSDRVHLYKQIDKDNLEIDYRFDSTGPSLMLVCTKNRKGFVRRLEEYENDIRSLRVLLQSPPTSMNSGERDDYQLRIDSAIKQFDVEEFRDAIRI